MILTVSICLLITVGSVVYISGEINWTKTTVINSLYDAERRGLNPCSPKHVHISYGDSLLDIVVVWATIGNCPGQVKYGIHPWGLERMVKSKDVIFVEQNSKGLQFLHKAVLKNLTSDKTYFYNPIGNQTQAGPFYFKTSKLGNDWSPDFLMFGDLGIHSDTTPSLVNEALSGKSTALFHVGDFAYDLKNAGGLVGDHFFDLIEPAAAAVPYMTCPGNHEIDGETFAHYRHRFAMPGADWPAPLNRLWYSLDIGPVHFVSYSSEVFFTNHGDYVAAQRNWLVHDLDRANKNRDQVPWIIAFGHRPLYCSTQIGDDCSHDDSKVRAGLEDIFYKMKVDLVVQAHEHNYERLWPVYRGQVLSHSYVDPSAPVQLISGAAGSAEKTDHFPDQPRPSWSAFRLDAPALDSYGRLLVENLTHVFWEQRSMNNHTTLDSIWIVKNTNWTAEILSVEGGLSQEAKSLLDRCDGSFLKCHSTLIFSISAGVVFLVVSAVVIRKVIRSRRKDGFDKVWLMNENEEESDSEI